MRLSGSADVGRINPVRKVSDGDKIYIPRIGEEYSAESYQIPYQMRLPMLEVRSRRQSY